MEDKKLCPLSLVINTDKNKRGICCAEEGCAWWIPKEIQKTGGTIKYDNYGCAIKKIAMDT